MNQSALPFSRELLRIASRVETEGGVGRLIVYLVFITRGRAIDLVDTYLLVKANSSSSSAIFVSDRSHQNRQRELHQGESL